MTRDDYEAFCEIVLGFAELKGRQLSAPALELYWRAMQHWSIEEFRAAAEQLLRTCEFFPTPKDFEALRKAGRPTAAEAWLQALQHAASSAYRNGPLGDPLIDRAVAALGGYRVIAMCEDAKLHFLERRFAEHYESIQDAEEVRAALPQLTGSDAVSHSSTFRVTGPRSAKDILGRIAHAHNGAAERTQETQWQ